MNTGEATAAELYRQARTGVFRLDTATARKCAANFLRFADALDPRIADSHAAHTLTGVGDFDSAHQLRAGFEAKAHALTETLTALQDSAVQLAAAHLLAAGLIQATDDTHARPLLAATAALPTP
ncbi:hypothetical protein D7D52_31620 [Nocardia yunnanensis]|uniref:Uncharacterized protein n=1 Tax=Nocardia yunnanensis TaxID=2382165 RepID=A0A386ZJR7_9NOCA|nr:hypothetical protein [Nocardia yunnanensis]AYF77610.1 hypothetical protein D7D52_31620 [Nocardia yunnanensis]